VIVTHQDMKRHMRYCNSGARDFSRRHDLDWADFVKNGISDQVLIDTGDAMAIGLVEKIKQEGES
jgi:hypothetical protein